MTALPPEILKELREEYLAAFPELLREIRESEKRSEWKVIERQFHKFAGSGTTYGLPLITEVARSIETYLMKNVLPHPQIVFDSISLFEKIVEGYRTNTTVPSEVKTVILKKLA